MDDFSPYEEIDWDDAINENKETPEERSKHLNNLQPYEAIDLLTEINFTEIFARSLYLKTYPLNKRSINTMPGFLLYNFECPDTRFIVDVYGFYNQTSKKFFTSSSPCMKSYMALDEKDSPLQALDRMIIGEIAAQKTIALFNNGRIEERRGGLMFQFLYNTPSFGIEGMIPLLYQAHNYNMGEIDIENIKHAEIFEGAADEDVVKKFVVSDAIGFGDTRIKMRYHALKTNRLQTNVGLVTTIPTAVAFSRGMIGSHFSSRAQRPCVDLHTMLRLAMPAVDKLRHPNPAPLDKHEQDDLTTVIETGKTFLLGSSDWLSANLLDNSLGNGHHWGFGGFLESQFIIQDKFYCLSQLTFEYFIAHKKSRLFLLHKNAADFAREKFEHHAETRDEEMLLHDLNFLNANIVDFFYPQQFDVTIRPGFMAQASIEPHIIIDRCSRETYDRCWDIGLGYDFWYQHQETIRSISANDINLIDLNNGLAPHAYQSKLYASISYKKTKPTVTHIYTLQGDETVSMSGIGRDFTLTFRFAIEF